MADRRLAALAKRLSALGSTSAVRIGPVVDAVTGGVILPGDLGGRVIRGGFLPRGFHVASDGTIVTTAEAWAALGIEPAWEAGEIETAAGGAPSVLGAAVGADVWLPDYARPLFDRSAHQFVALLGGRGGAKSTAVAIVLLLLARVEPLRVVCARQFQASIAASVKTLIDDWIGRLGLADEFKSTETAIEHRRSGAGFLFIGLDRNTASVKSLEGADVCWVEEAHSITKTALDVLIPTVRRPGSAIWCTYNPESADDPIDDYFRGEAGAPPRSYIAEVDYRDNPFFFGTSLPAVLARDMTGPDRNRADHIWLGHYAFLAEAAVLPAAVVGNINSFGWPEVVGLDFSGGGRDPHALIRARVSLDERTIHIVNEFYSHAALEELPDVVNGFVAPGESIRADGSRPDVIDFLGRHNLDVRAAPKGSGSVLTGIMWLRGFRLVVSPECPRFAEEARRYSWKVDRRTGRILTDPIGQDNHGIDALRYGCAELMAYGEMAGGGVIWLRI